MKIKLKAAVKAVKARAARTNKSLKANASRYLTTAVTALVGLAALAYISSAAPDARKFQATMFADMMGVHMPVHSGVVSKLRFRGGAVCFYDLQMQFDVCAPAKDMLFAEIK